MKTLLNIMPCASLDEACRLIILGFVKVNGVKITSPSFPVLPENRVTIKGKEVPYGKEKV